jgi:formylglycine-generating enzyme required for sulfatase activity/serine/threonine protein kinase
MNVRAAPPVGAPGYRLVRWLAASGAASLYVASDRSSGRAAAIKIFHHVDGRALQRLERRLQANAELSHPCIVPVHEIGRTTDRRLYHSMPLLVGFEQARHDLVGRPLRIAALLRGLLEGLAHAHRCGTVHGGIKPSNVLFDKQGYAQLADFGIACSMAEPGRPPPERGRYLSPEQAEGKAPDPRSDLYSIGMLAYELLAGASSIQKRQAGQPLGGRAGPAVPRLPPRAVAWQPWMDRALAVSPDQRFQTAEEMAGALGGVIGSPGLDGDDPATESIPSRRAPRWWSYAAALAAAIVMLIGWAASGHRRTPMIVAATQPAAASFTDPALPTSTMQPTSALPLASGPASPLADRVQGLIATADTLRANGHLFSPPFHNAASHYLAALAFDPGNPDAMAGIDAMLATLRNQLDASWRNASDTTAAARMLQQGDELAEHARTSARQTWRWYHARLARQVGEAVAQAARARDARKVSALEPLAKALPARFPDGLDLAGAQRMVSTTAASHADARASERKPMHDPHGPQLVYVPATDDAPAFAIARNDVTRADYAAFARATHRPAAKCLEAHNPFSRLRHLTWRSPGFAQDGDHPVVCVSWDDASAYAAWLSKETGQHYRLASSSQWLRAARGMPKGSPCKLGNVDDVSRQSRFDNDRWSCDDGAAETAPVGRYAASAVGAYGMYGNVSEWVAGGSPGSRPFRGVSWRDGSHESALGRHGTADPDVGYNSVGFRVMRVIDPTHPAPLVASGR